MKKTFSVSCSQSLLLVIDIQSKLSPVMAQFEQIKHVTEQLASAAKLYDIPQLVTEQYKQGLGTTDEALKAVLNGATYFDKTHFSAFKENGFKQLLADYNKPQIIVVGMEAHVCVLQTCLDLLAHDYRVFVIADGICSRKEIHRDIALNQLQSAGAVITSAESIIFQWAEVANSATFKKILNIVK